MADLALRFAVLTAGACMIGASAYSLSTSGFGSSWPVARPGYPVRIDLPKARPYADSRGVEAALGSPTVFDQGLSAEPMGGVLGLAQTEQASWTSLGSSAPKSAHVELAEGLLKDDFPLPRTTPSREEIKSRHRLVIHGRQSGWIELIVDERNELFVEKSQLTDNFPEVLILFPAGKGRLSLDELRSEGLTIEYNAGKDELHIS